MSPYPVADRGVRGGDSLNTNLVNEAMVGKSLSLIQDEINMKLEDYRKVLKNYLALGHIDKPSPSDEIAWVYELKQKLDQG